MILLNKDLFTLKRQTTTGKQAGYLKMGGQSLHILSRQRPINLSAMLKRLSELLQHQVTD